MAKIAERYDSRASRMGDQPSIDLRYVVTETENEAEVRALTVMKSPPFYEDLERVSVSCDPQGGGIWYTTVRYALIEDESEYEFDTSGGSQRMSCSLATVERKAVPGHVAPDYSGAINVRDGRVEGADATVPQFLWSTTRSIHPMNMTQAYKMELFQLTGKVCDKPFAGFAKGEVLFLGASGQRRGKERWSVAYKFASSPNVVNVPIGNSGLMVSKEGWQHLWVRFEDDVNSDRLVKVPVGFYVEQIYEYGDFTRLGIYL